MSSSALRNGEDLELGSIAHVASSAYHDNQNSEPDSLRSSFEDDCYYQRQDCTVHIHDDIPIRGAADAVNDNKLVNPLSVKIFRDPEELRERLGARDPTRTRWINMVGWSKPMIDEITATHLGAHSCLELESISKQMLGGPIAGAKDGKFIWLQTQLWFVGNRSPIWSSIRQLRLRMIVCLPTSEHAGTLITNFIGPFDLADEISSIITDRLIEDHPMGRQSLGCAWVLAFTFLRTMAEQLDFAFEVLDPINSSSQLSFIPRLNDLPMILQQSDRLARIDRYLSSLEEFAAFFISVRHECSPENSSQMAPKTLPCLSRSTIQCANLEASRAQRKIEHEQRLCKTYLKQFDTLVQLVISYSATQITERLDQGRVVADRFAKIGMFLAAVAGIVAPTSLLTGYYGMNVQELNPGTTATLFDFWQIAIPVLLATAVCFAFIGLWSPNLESIWVPAKEHVWGSWN